MLEKKIQDKILKFLNSRPGGLWTKRNATGYGTGGVLDIFGTCLEISGHYCEIEVKAESGELSKRQSLRIKKVIAAGGIAFVARSVEDVKEVLDLK